MSRTEFVYSLFVIYFRVNDLINNDDASHGSGYRKL